MTVNPVRRLLSAIDKDPIILSHHPLCGEFDDHVFRIRGRYVCIGCTTVYPSALVALLLLWVLNVSSFEITFPIAFSSFALNLIRFLSKSHRYSALFNVFLGVSLGASVLAVIHSSGSLQLAAVLLVLSVTIIFSYAKGNRVLAKCRSCERYREWPSCYNSRPLGR